VVVPRQRLGYTECRAGEPLAALARVLTGDSGIALPLASGKAVGDVHMVMSGVFNGMSIVEGSVAPSLPSARTIFRRFRGSLGVMLQT
jgi:hypothetical protein